MHIHTHAHTQNMYIHTHKHTHTYIQRVVLQWESDAAIWPRTCIYTHIYDMHISIYTYIYIHIHTYRGWFYGGFLKRPSGRAHTYTHTHITCIHIHIYIRIEGGSTVGVGCGNLAAHMYIYTHI